jgi:peptidyl-prolyl cis-trans isomerase C
MRTFSARILTAGVAVFAFAHAVVAQTPPAAPATPTANPAPATAATMVAATVNGQPITEAAVLRGLKRVPPEEQAKARGEILVYLIDNLLIDQHLLKQNLSVDPKAIETRITEIKAELAKHQQDLAKMLAGLQLTEEELRGQIAADLRWEKFVNGPDSDAKLKELFSQNLDMFDGTTVRARHILVTPAATAEGMQAAQTKIAAVKKQIEDEVAAGLAKLPATADNLAKEQERVRLIDAAFANAARSSSDCPSKKDGGDLNWFPRAGSMVEPFAKAAFALKPYQLSEIVPTSFGFHLILPTERRAGQPTKYEDVKDAVQEVYCGRVRETLLAQLKPTAQIVIPTAK